MADVKIPYYTTRQRPGRPKWGYWAPCLARRNKKSGKIEPTLMAKLGFKLVDCGEDGPRAWAIAESWNKKWKHALAELKAGKSLTAPGKIERIYPPDSLGEAFARFRKTGVWRSKKPRTQEDWMRGWKYIEPYFGDVDPRTVAMEHIDLWYNGDTDTEVKGLVWPTEQGGVGVGEAYRAMKIWRAMWEAFSTINRADGERYCLGKDPSLSVKRKTPKKRDAIWLYEEAERLVKRALRMEYYGLAAALATCWDTQFSPVDVRMLTTAKLYPDADGPVFDVDRTKTGKGAIGTLSRRTLLLLKWYVGQLPFTLHPDTPIFHTRGGQPGPKGGRPRPPVPYTKDTLGDDFRAVREAEFKGDLRRISDFRRSGAVEAVAGKVDPAALAAKMANTIDESRELQQTYLPHQAAVVRLADEARARGRIVLGGGKKGSNK
jgi:hypothetical protein